MTFAHDLPRPAEPGCIDQFVYLHGVSFLEYEALLQMRGDRSVPRITYLRGELELKHRRATTKMTSRASRGCSRRGPRKRAPSWKAWGRGR